MEGRTTLIEEFIKGTKKEAMRVTKRTIFLTSCFFHRFLKLTQKFMTKVLKRQNDNFDIIWYNEKGQRKDI
jgi:seryl-tRNA(Sec) selenium transferase